MSPITECHLFKDYVPVPLCHRRFFCRNGHQFVLAVHHCGNAVRRSVCLGHHHENAVHPVHTHKNHIEISQKRQNHTGLSGAVVHTISPHHYHNGKSDIQHKGHDRPRKRHDNARLHVPVRHFSVCVLKAAHLIIFLRKRLYHPDARDIFPHDAHDIIHALLHPFIERYALQGDIDHCRNQDWRHNAENRCQPGIHDKGNGNTAKQQNRRTDSHGLAGLNEALHIIGVRGHPGIQGRQPEFVQLSAGKINGFPEQISSYFVYGFLRHAYCHTIRPHIRLAHIDHQQKHYRSPQQYQFYLLQRCHIVNQMFQYIWEQQFSQSS